MAAAGWRVRYEPDAAMGHDHRVTFRAWFARRADYGTSAAALEQLHPGAVRPLYASWWTAGAWTAALARPPGHRRRAHRHRDRPARPPPVPRHRRTLAACPAAGRRVAAGRPAGRRRHARRRSPARQRPVPDLVAARHPGGARRSEAAPPGRGADPAPAAARLGRPETAARPRPLRRRPAARRRRLQPRRLAGLPKPPHGPPAAAGDRRQAPAWLTANRMRDGRLGPVTAAM